MRHESLARPRVTRRSTLLAAPLAALMAAFAACAGGVDPPSTSGEGGEGGEGGAGGSPSASSGQGGMGATGGGQGGTGATGGQGGTGATGGQGGEGGAPMTCAPGATQLCYEGPFGTQGVGACQDGLETCLADGSAWGPCEGQILPAQESCLMAQDEDCNGLVNEGCTCDPGAIEVCYSGPPGTPGVGECKEGTSTCNPDGMGFGPCIGEVVPKGETCATAADDNCDGSSNCDGTAIWSQGFPDPASASAGYQIAAEPSGGAIVTGRFSNQIDFGVALLQSAGMDDVFVAKLDAGGSALWAKRMGGAALEWDTGVAVDATGRAFVVGYYSGTVDFGGGPLPSAGLDDTFIVALDAGGNHLWSKRFGDATDQRAEGVAVTPAGDVVVAGYFRGSMNLGGGALVSSGDIDVFVAKLDAMGNHIWSKSFGSPAGSQQAYAVTADGAGNILLTGRFEGTLDFGGGVLTTNGPPRDGYLVKLDPDGNHLWSFRFGGPENDRGERVATDAAGNVMLVGDFRETMDLNGGVVTSSGSWDFFLAKFNPAGQHIWSKSLGIPVIGEQDGRIAVDAAGNVVLAGGMISSVDFGGGPLPSGGQGDAFVAKYDPSGQHLWSRSFGDAAGQKAWAVAVSPAGEPLIAGSFQGTIDFGAGPHTGAPNESALFVAKLLP